jgi:hypothetical protein
MEQKMFRIQQFFFFCLCSLLFVNFSSSRAQMNVGEKLPVFQLLDVTGKPVALESFSGKVVLIHLWKCK